MATYHEQILKAPSRKHRRKQLKRLKGKVFTLRHPKDNIALALTCASFGSVSLFTLINLAINAGSIHAYNINCGGNLEISFTSAEKCHILLSQRNAAVRELILATTSLFVSLSLGIPALSLTLISTRPLRKHSGRTAVVLSSVMTALNLVWHSVQVGIHWSIWNSLQTSSNADFAKEHPSLMISLVLAIILLIDLTSLAFHC